MTAPQPWFEAPLEAEEEKKVAALAAAVAAVVNVRPRSLPADSLSGSRCRGCEVWRPWVQLPSIYPACAASCMPAARIAHRSSAALPCLHTTGVGCPARLLHPRHLHPLPAGAALEREEGRQGGCCAL